jgi:hypothetical protein
VSLRIYTVLDATLPVSPFPGQTRLWIAAAGKREARALMADRGITFREETFAGPVGTGPFVAAFQRAGLLNSSAVYAYPVPHEPGTPVLRLDQQCWGAHVAVMGDLLAGPR